MRVLVTWGSKRGGTEGIARIIGSALFEEGFDVVMLPANEVQRASDFDAVIVGGALYANRWHSAARRFVVRQQRALRRLPVWLFSSGPLDESAARDTIPPTRQVQNLMARIGAIGHITFGGRLSPEAQGFPASAMAREHAGDWRDPQLIRTWAKRIARELPDARPGPATETVGASALWLLAHAFGAWAASAAHLGFMLALTTPRSAVFWHALAAPLVFGVVARPYFKRLGAREPLPAATAFLGVGATLETALIAALVARGGDSWAGLGRAALPYLLVFFAAWIIGWVTTTFPLPKPTAAR